MTTRIAGAVLVSLVSALSGLSADRATAGTAPYPPSPVIRSLSWDANLMRLRDGAGDNFPMTWVEGDRQITAWGDGEGFQPGAPRLSLGLARLSGHPPDVFAKDFPSDADTVEGSGSRAIKASGLLWVDGVLYMWVRNYRPPGSDDFTNARLGWSRDGGAHWTWADWHFADTFGCPEFVQFGPAYSGARDAYVYVVSQGNDSAYGYSPDIVLARVPRNHVTDRAQYEFFGGRDGEGSPRWVRELAQRKPIFSDPNGTQRIAVTYNAGLRRYVLTTSHLPPGHRATHTAALGVFDAPEPWGPWTTLYYDDHWSGTNRTYHHKFPTSWMSADGREMWLVYSGLDGSLYTLCATRAVLETRDDASPAAPLMRTVDLDPGEQQELTLPNGSRAHVRLVAVQEHRDAVRRALREALATVEVNGTSLTLTSATYHLPVTAVGVQIDCPITLGHTAPGSRQNVWGLRKAARFRLWPAGSPWMPPGTFTYPVKQRWFASDTQMANEPTFVNGDETPGARSIYYHWGLDFGGAEGLVEVVAATDGLVVSAAGKILPDYTNSPAKPRYDVVYVLDDRGWYYRYSHLKRIDVTPGRRLRMGEAIGLLGKEGGSGGWSHLHFDITSRQPSGEWGIQDAYAYAWEAWRNEYRPRLLAVARPHRLARPGDTVLLDGQKSWSAAGKIARYEWTFTDATTSTGPVVHRRYPKPGTYSEVLKVTDREGRTAFDFAVVQVMDTNLPANLPPTIHAAYHPTIGIRAGDPVTFKVRSFRTTFGDETWDFGDGTPPRKVKSDGNASVHAPDGYAVTEHRYARPGHYIARVERGNERGETATARLLVHVEEAFQARTHISVRDGRWHLNGRPTCPNSPAQGLLMNVRMVNAVFEDRLRPAFDPEANTDAFLAKLPDYAAHGVGAFTFCLQGGMPGYEGALNSAYAPDGSLRQAYLQRVRRVIEACARAGMAVILSCFYQRQDQVLADEAAVRQAVANTARWIQKCGFSNVMLEIANEFDHGGFDHRILTSEDGEVELMELARRTAPGLLVSTSGLGHGRYPDRLAKAADYLLIHFNGTKVADIPARIRALKQYGKPIVCNEDDKLGDEAVRAAELSVANGAS